MAPDLPQTYSNAKRALAEPAAHSARVDSVRTVTLTLALLLVLLGASMLAAWFIGDYRVVAPIEGFPTMKANAAVGFVLLGCGLVAAELRWWAFSKVCAGLLVLLTGATLAQYSLDIDLGIDQWLVADSLSDNLPGRMSLGTVYTLLISACLLLLMDARSAVGGWLFDALLLVGASTPVVALTTYAFQPAALFNFAPLSSMSLPTVMGFLLGFAASMLIAPAHSRLAVVSSSSRGGRLVRKMITPLLVLPLLFGITITTAVTQDQIDSGLGAALFTTLFPLLGLVALVYFASQINIWEHLLTEEREAKADLQGKLAWVLEGSSDAILLFSERGNVLLANRGACELFGYREQELHDLTLDELIPERFHSRHRQLVTKFVADHSGSQFNADPLRMVAVQANGNEIPVMITVVKRSLRDQLFFAATIRDASGLEAEISVLRDAAEIDPLTGVGNRRALSSFAEKLTTAPAPENAQIAVLAIDLDHFKQVNDHYGHDAGDRVLTRFCRVCEDFMRDSDQLFRSGGEEFVLILPRVDAATARRLGERIRSGVEHTHFAIGNGRNIRLTCSIGVETVLQQDFHLGRNLAIADQRLYLAKTQGRNRVVDSMPGEE
jgi:diguanylate cyclase (GGDEF)-like protein/PAS domain S-box-containing protein